MPTTRSQAAALRDESEPPAKKPKTEGTEGKEVVAGKAPVNQDYPRETGTIERGHIYFFYRPKVQHEQAHSIDDVKNLHILLVPRPPAFTSWNEQASKADLEDAEMTLLQPGADAIPKGQTRDGAKKRFRLITVGKKQLPDPETGGSGKGRKETFWATVATVGDDLHALEKGLGENTYETKTRGTRHNEPARLAGRGAYAIVNNEPRVPLKRETHLGYHLSHPTELGDVQKAMGIAVAASFIIQVKNPLAPSTGLQRVGLPAGRRAKYPTEIMQQTFGKGTKGRESYGLRFVSCERIELLDYEGAELLMIAARAGDEGVEQSLGEGRGQALHETEEKESNETIDQVFEELALKKDVFPPDALEGHWI